MDLTNLKQLILEFVERETTYPCCHGTWNLDEGPLKESLDKHVIFFNRECHDDLYFQEEKSERIGAAKHAGTYLGEFSDPEGLTVFKVVGSEEEIHALEALLGSISMLES